MTKTREQLMIVESVNTAGAVSYWRIASEIHLDQLASAWRAAGLDEKLLPSAPKDEVALGRAVADMVEKRVLVRPLARRGAWGIVEEVVTERPGMTPRLDHTTLVNVFFRQGQMVVEQAQGTWAQRADYDTRILSAYSKHRNTLAHSDVSSWLLDIAYGQGAVSLRESGGVYFIPKAGVAHWARVADAVEAGGGGSVFRIPAVRTAEAVAAITDAITAEAEAAALALENELVQTGDDALGKRALATRTKTVQELLAKLNSYEELLGQQLFVRERVSTLQATLSAVALSAENEAA
jgi:hypothetical protein